MVDTRPGLGVLCKWEYVRRGVQTAGQSDSLSSRPE